MPGQRPKSNVRAQERWDLENAAYEGAIRKQRRDVMSGSLLPDEVRGEIEGSYEEGEGRDKAIKRAVAKQSLSSVHGLYIPGDFNANPTQVASADSTTKVADQRLNQPRDAKSREERATRDEYEQLLIREARNRGMPTMAIYGGSWRLLEAFGGQVETIPGDPHQRRDNRHGHLGRLNDQAHGVGLEPNSFIGGISPVVESETGKTPKHSIDSVNSTHWAVASADTSGKLVSRFRDEENPDLEGMPKNPDEELQVTGWGPGWKDNHRVPEAFETRHGAPMMGIQWHPEAYITGAGRTEATPEARESSDRLFKGFNQAMRAYAGRQQVNEELLKRFSKLS